MRPGTASRRVEAGPAAAHLCFMVFQHLWQQNESLLGWDPRRPAAAFAPEGMVNRPRASYVRRVGPRPRLARAGRSDDEGKRECEQS